MKIIGLSSSPTPYKIKTPEEHYTRCGADILLNGVGYDLEGESRCITCGSLTRITISHGRLTQIQPAEAVLHVVEIPAEHGVTQIVCEGSPIFDKQACLQTWLKGYRGLQGKIFSLPDYMPHASQLVAERVRPASPEDPTLMSVIEDENPRIMRCADCGCSPAECNESTSAMECPRCRLDSCCCGTPPGAV